MATIRKKHRAPVSVFQRDPGPWSRLLIDWLATLAVIMIFGLVMLFSASYTTGYLRMGDSFHYIKQQALCMLIGLGCMFAMSYVDHRFLRRMVVPGYLIVLAMLAVTLTMAPLNGCRRWIRFAGLTLQSSEVAKFEMILFSSHLAAKAPQVERLDPERRILLTPREWLRVRVWKQLVVPVLPLIPVVILLAMEPHMSGILLTTAIVGTILLLGGSGGIITWGCAGVALFLLETLLKHVDSIDYLQSRLDGWTQDLDRMTSQTKQSLYAIGSGGATGLGLGNSIEKQLWLPESTNDFIFSVVCEELGFVGAVIVIVLFVLFLVQGFWIAFHAENRFCTLVGIGIMALSGVGLWLFAPALMGIFTADAAVIALGAQVLRIEAFAEPMFGASIVASGAMQGAGDSTGCFVLNLVSMWGIRLTLASLLAPHFGLVGVWMAMSFELTMRGVLFLVRLVRGRWLDKGALA